MRVNSTTALIGNRGTGKTDFLKKCIKASSHQKALIVEIFDSPVWTDMATYEDPDNTPIPRISEHELPYWEKGVYFYYDTDEYELFETIESKVYNALVIMEDSSKYVEGKLTKKQRRFVIDSKQKNVDLIFVFHSMMDVPNNLIRILDYLVIAKTGEEWDRYLDKKYPKNVKDAWEEVQNHKDPFFKKAICIRK